MVTVANQARPQFIRGELLPDVVIMPRQQRVRTIAQVRAEPRAGTDSIANARSSGSGVSQSHDHAAAHQFCNERDRSLKLGGQGDEADAPARGLLQPLELIPVGFAYMLLRMRSA